MPIFIIWKRFDGKIYGWNRYEPRKKINQTSTEAKTRNEVKKERKKERNEENYSGCIFCVCVCPCEPSNDTNETSKAGVPVQTWAATLPWRRVVVTPSIDIITGNRQQPFHGRGRGGRRPPRGRKNGGPLPRATSASRRPPLPSPRHHSRQLDVEPWPPVVQVRRALDPVV